jgi:hypothetical protein
MYLGTADSFTVTTLSSRGVEECDCQSKGHGFARIWLLSFFATYNLHIFIFYFCYHFIYFPLYCFDANLPYNYIFNKYCEINELIYLLFLTSAVYYCLHTYFLLHFISWIHQLLFLSVCTEDGLECSLHGPLL